MSTPAFAHVNSPRGAVQALTFYWSVSLLEWVRGTQPSGGGGGGGTVDQGTGGSSDWAVHDDAIGTVTDMQALPAGSDGTVISQLKTIAALADSQLFAQTVTGTNITGINGVPPAQGAGGANGTVLRVVEANDSAVTVAAQGIRIDAAPYTLVLEYDGTNNPIYIGKASQGSLKSAAAWQIRKLTWDGSSNVTDIQFANGSPAYNAIWNNRGSFAYS